MASVGEIGIDIKANASNFKAGVRSAEASLRSFSSIGQNLIQGVGMALGNLTFASVTQGVKGLLGGMIAGNAEFERYNLQFSVLLKSTEAATRRMEELTKFAKETPFELPDVVRASKLLEVMGGELLSTGASLRLIGDAASGAGRGFEEVAMWAGRYYAGLKAGKSDGEALLRLREMALISGDASQKLASLSESGGKASEMWKVFTDELGRFDGMMEKQSKTFEGVMSNVRDSAAQALRQIGEPFFDQAKRGIVAVYEYLSGSEGQALVGRLRLAAAEFGKLSVEAGVDFFKRVAQGVVRFVEFVASERGQAMIATIAKITAGIIALGATARVIQGVTAAFTFLSGIARGSLGILITLDTLNKRSAAGWATQTAGANTLTASLTRVRGAAVAAIAGFSSLLGIASTAASVLAIPVAIAAGETKKAEAEAKFAEARAGMMKSKLLESFERRFHKDVQQGDAAVEKTFQSMRKRFGDSEVFTKYKTLLSGWLAQKGKAINEAGNISKVQNEDFAKKSEEEMRKLMETLIRNVGKGGGAGGKKKGKSEAERDEEQRLARVADMFRDMRLRLAQLKAATFEQRIEAERLHGAYGELTAREWEAIKPLLAEEEARKKLAEAKAIEREQTKAAFAATESNMERMVERFKQEQEERRRTSEQIKRHQEENRAAHREWLVDQERTIAYLTLQTDYEKTLWEVQKGRYRDAWVGEKALVLLWAKKAQKAKDDKDADEEEARRLERSKERYQDYLKDLALRLKVASASSDELRLKWKLLTDGLSEVDAEDVIKKTRAVEKIEEFRSMIESMTEKLSGFFADTFANLFQGNVKNFFSNVLGGFRQLLAEMAAEYLKSYLKKIFMGLLMKVFGSMGGGGQDLMSGGEAGMETFARGGRVSDRRPSIVGERGAELFVPNTPGTIIPNHLLAGMGGGSPINVTITVNTPNVDSFRRSQGQIMQDAVTAAMIAAKRNRGL